MRRATPRLLALLAVAALIAGLLMLTGPAAFASYRLSPQASPSSSTGPSNTATASPSPSGSSSGLPLPGGSSLPTTTKSAAPTDSESAAPDTSVLGEQIPQTGNGYAMPLLLGGTALAIASFILHRRLSRAS